MVHIFSEFQEVRSMHEFFDVCRTPELACEVTLQVATLFCSFLLLHCLTQTWKLVCETCVILTCSPFDVSTWMLPLSSLIFWSCHKRSVWQYKWCLERWGGLDGSSSAVNCMICNRLELDPFDHHLVWWPVMATLKRTLFCRVQLFLNLWFLQMIWKSWRQP